MRKFHYQQILELLKTIEELQGAKQYGECQEGALFLCDFIDDVQDKGTRTVALLEEYCEFLFKANNGEIGEKLLKKHFIKIKNSLTHELKPDQIEMAFLSYKASMSDSLESIYLAAKADPQCDAYWIPIPYYSRNKDGTFGDMRYEGHGYFGSELDITDWKSYDIEARRPDVIFTFNPYDEMNIVTSVHPDFYCERLRNFTDLLVYVPYFVTVDDVHKHMSTVNGCVFAHKVIVQSERVRAKYIQAFKDVYGNKLGAPEDKFVALGSPKFDKCINARREDYNLPDEWRNLIDENNGNVESNETNEKNHKKVIFYNSSIGAILQGDAQYLKKLRHVHETFRNRNDVVLWWRPHPLNQTTYQSMRPQLLGEYEQIISEYKQGAWGIYDDSPDLHRAITWTDAYYGDVSSLMPMFVLMGKPLMSGDVNSTSSGLNLYPGYFSVSGNNIWISALGINSFFRMNKSNGGLELLGSFSEKGTPQNVVQYGGIVEFKDRLYFTPMQAKEILAYSIPDDTFEKISYKFDDVDSKNDTKEIIWAFHDSIAFGSYIFFSPYQYPALMRLNTETNEVTYYSDWVDSVKVSTSKDVLLSRPQIVGKVLWYAACQSNAIVAFDTETCTSTVYKVGNKEYRYSGICFDGENFWLSPRVGTVPLVKWNPQKGIIKEFREFIYENTPNPSYSMHSGIYHDGYCWLFPSLAGHVVKVNVQTHEITIVQEFENDCKEVANSSTMIKFYMVRFLDGYIYCCKHRNDMTTIIEYNCVTKERKDMVFRLSEEIEPQLEPLISQSFLTNPDKIKIYNDCVYNEKFTAPLSKYIDYVVDHSNDETLVNSRKAVLRSINANSDGTAGEAICAYVKNMVYKGDSN